MTGQRRRPAAGFTLIELIVALSISSIVLIGSFSILTSMVQTEVESMRKGSVNGWSLASLVAMNRKLESGTVLLYPPFGAGADAVAVCQNWSRLMNTTGGASFDGGAAYTDVYCWDSTNNVLRQMTPSPAGCPAAYTPPVCTAAAYGASSVIATGVYRDPSNNFIFTTDPTTAGTIRVRYTVGRTTSGTALNEGNHQTNLANPQTMTFDTRLTLSKGLGAANTSD